METPFAFLKKFAFYKRLTLALVLGSLFVSLATLYTVSRRTSPHLPYGAYLDPARGLTVADFQYHLQFVRSFWENPHARPYTPRFHRAVMEDWLHTKVTSSLGFGYSPTRLLTLLPVSRFPDPAAYLLWTGLAAVAGHALALVLALKADSPARLLPCLMLASVFYSFAYQGALALGQTAVWSCLLLALLAFGTTPAPGKLRFGLQTACLWFLTVRPPLALMAGTGLLAGKKTRLAGAACALVLAEIAAFCLVLGPSWMLDYASLAGHYDTETSHALFSARAPEMMSNLRQVLLVTAGWGDSLASALSNGAWVLASLAALLLYRRRKPEGNVPEAMGLLVLPYCLFSSHLSFTENLALALPVGLLLRTRHPGRWLAWGLLFFTLEANGLGRIPGIMTLAFAAKSVLAWIYGQQVFFPAKAAAREQQEAGEGASTPRPFLVPSYDLACGKTTEAARG
jgi:hypothetical protein